MGLSKSWKMVLVTFVTGLALPFINAHLPESSQISEEFANNFIYMFLGSAGIGVVAKVAKLKNEKAADDNQVEQKIPMEPSHDFVPRDTSLGPPLKTGGRYYLTNFVKSDRGNSLKHGTPFLYVKMKGVRSYMTGQIFKGENLIQIEQTDNKGVLRFELFKKNQDGIVSFERGKYTLVIAGDRGSSDSNRITDEFEIV